MSTLSVWNTPFALAPAPWGATVVRRPSAPQAFVPAAEVTREKDDAVVRLELPGLATAADVTVEVVDHRLVVSGERRGEQSRRGYREVRYGSFRRSFTLPAHVDGGSVSASYEAGVLTVRVAGVHVEPPTYRVEVAGVAPAPEPVPDPTTEAGEGAQAA